MLNVRRDDGSLMLGLLATIIVASIVATLGLVIVTVVRDAGHDQQYTPAVQAADTGINTALFLANNATDPTALCPTLTATSTECVGSSAGANYRWWIDPSKIKLMNGKVVEYVVSSRATQGTVTRTVQADVKMVPRFPVAAFGDKEVELKGSNGASSYNHLTGATNTGNGDVGSNGNIDLNGNSTTVDNVMLYDHDASGNTCTAHGGSGCDNVTAQSSKLDLASDANMKFITDQLAACAAASPLQSWTASQQPVGGDGLVHLTPQANGAPYCFSTLNFDRDTVIDGGPVVIFVQGAINLEHSVNVNCQSCTSGNPTPDGTMLQIFSAGSTDTESVAIGNHSYYAGTIYAPRAACLGNPSAAQADIYGALICGAIGRITSGNQGGWSFHFDDALLSVGSGGWQVARWDEN